MTVLRPTIAGVPAAPGTAIGRWADPALPTLPAPRTIEPSEVQAETARLRQLAKVAADELRQLATSVGADGHQDEAAIFDAHALMAGDPALIDGAVRRIATEHVDVVGAILAAAREVADQLRALEDELLSARAADVLDVGERIARLAGGLSTGSSLDQSSIIVAEDLAPSVTATLPRDRLLGICLERSSPTAHAAILARAYGIPAVVGVSGLLEALRSAGTGVEIAIDGSTGEVVVDPDAEERARFERLTEATAKARARDLSEATLAAITRDGAEVTLLANIGSPDEAERAVNLGATGVGLFRTEFLFLERSKPPTEDEQVAAYRRAVEAFNGGPVTIRLLDVGGDKPIPYLPLPREDNPFLGVRALRLAGDRPDLFITQLRACYRVSIAGPIRIMAPMIADATDVETLVSLADQARAGLQRDGLEHADAELGVMLEIPSAILTAATYFPQIAFASLGTNDLLQYALAVDRGNPALERYRDAMHPALLRLVRMAVEAAAERGISLGVCGEMAGDPAAALALVGLGVRSLSMSAASLPAVRRAIRGADTTKLAAEADQACRDRSAEEARARFTRLLPP